jgi:hypothetical protein
VRVTPTNDDEAMVAFLIALLGVILALLVVAMVMAADDESPPHGCAWVDLDPSKASDVRLACVPGYFPSEGER